MEFKDDDPVVLVRVNRKNKKLSVYKGLLNMFELGGNKIFPDTKVEEVEGGLHIFGGYANIDGRYEKNFYGSKLGGHVDWGCFCYSDTKYLNDKHIEITIEPGKPGGSVSYVGAMEPGSEVYIYPWPNNKLAISRFSQLLGELGVVTYQKVISVAGEDVRTDLTYDLREAVDEVRKSFDQCVAKEKRA